MKSKFFETIKVLDGEIYHLFYHQSRYESVLASLGCSTPQKLSEHIKAPKKGLFRCKIIYDATSIEVEFFPYQKREIQTLKILHCDTIEYACKSTDRVALDALFAQREQCDDVLIVRNNLITDTSIANIAFHHDDLWYTPKTPLLRGTTRQRLLNEGKIIEADIRVEDLGIYTQVALLNAMIEFDIIAQENVREIMCLKM